VIERAKAKRWTLVANTLHKILKKEFKYSARSCQRRFIALQNDAATIPPELDDDPLRRREEKAARTLARLHDRNLHTITEKQQKEQKRLVAGQEKLKKALEKKERAAQRAQAAEEKARIALAQASIRNLKAKELEADRLRQEAQIQMLRKNQAISAPRPPKVVEEPCPSMALLTSTASTPGTATQYIAAAKAKRTSLTNIDDPRARMTTAELTILCTRRGISKNGTKPTIIKRLAEHDLNMGMESRRLYCVRSSFPHMV
jgi:hypothetical protein